LLLLLLFILLSIPAVQTYLGRKATNYLNQTYKTNITINQVDLSYFGQVALKEVNVKDFKNDSLIHISSLETSILDYKNLYEGKLLFGAIKLDGLSLIIKTYKGEKNSNLDVFIEKLEGGDTLPRTKPSEFMLSSSNINITNSSFRYIDENLNTPEVLHAKALNINGSNFLIDGSNVSTTITSMSFEDKRGVHVKQLKTKFSYTLTQMRFDNLSITSEKSNIKGRFQFDYDRADFKDFNNKVLLSASFDNANISLDEVNAFYNEFGANQKVIFSTELFGTLNDFKAVNLNLRNNKETRIVGTIQFKNLLSKSDGFLVKGKYQQLASTYSDLTTLLPNILGDVFPSSFQTLGKFDMVGESRVTNKEVTADIAMQTAIGNVNALITITEIDDIDNASYEGNIMFSDFDLGAFIKDDNFGLATLNLDVKGRGFTRETLATQVSGNLAKFSFNNYAYSNLKVQGEIQKQIFEGDLNVQDENLEFTFKGLANFAPASNTFNFIADIKKANLKALHFFEKDSISQLSAQVLMDFKGSSIDNAFGTVQFKNTQYTNPIRTYVFDDMLLSSSFDDNNIRHIEVAAPGLLRGKINGKFKFKDLGKLAQNSAGSLYANYEPIVVGDGQFVDFNFRLDNQIVALFFPNMNMANKTILRGNIGSDEKDFKTTFKTAYLTIDDYTINTINFTIDNKNPLFNTFIRIDEVRTPYYDIDDFKLINKTLNDTLFFKTEFVAGKNKNDTFDLNLYHTINTDNQSVVGFKKSKINYNNYDWFINEINNKKNQIVFNNDLSKVKIDDFRINHADEFITLFGVMENDTEKDFTLNLETIDLAKITPEIEDFKMHGLIDGTVHIFQQNGDYYPRGSLAINQFEINELEMGVFKLDVTGDDALSNYQINGFIENDTFKSFTAQGNVDVSSTTPQINLDTYFDRFDLSILEALGDDVISNIRGKVTGGANFIGALSDPDIIGLLYLKDAGMTVPYLNVDFDFDNNASVSLVDHKFIFNNIALLDTKHYTSGRLYGHIGHTNFDDWSLDLKVSTNNLLVLDTQLDEESLYYGTAFISGEARIHGPTEALIIDVIARTEENTTFKIPIRDAESVGDNSFIRFVSKAYKDAENKGEQLVFDEVEGLELNFDLDVTRDAEIEIVIDQKTGSTLRGRGEGNLLIEINTNGKFNMYGDFITYEGTYNFIYGGLIEKRFRVQPGGTINWEGDPFAAQLDINAVYSTDANPAILLDNSTINRKIPVDVIINLTNQLLQPDIDFNINFPKTSSVIKSELLYKLQDKENRELQALSLVTSGTFVNRLSVGNGAVVGNLTERAKSIIDGILSDKDDKFNISLNYEQGERTPDSDIRTDDRLGVTLSTQISDRVLINGKVGVPVGGVNETVVIGDVEIEFLLNEEGTLRAKVFNRENDFQSLGFGEEIGYTQGVGLSYQVDFDSFKELIRNVFKKASAVEAEEKPAIEDNDFPDFMRFKEED
jgi:hypothetical protein